MAGKEPDIGPTARTVAANVKRLRGEMNYTQLSERLEEVASWSINAVGIRRIESGERRVTPDDLIALARALGVWVVTLMMPYTEDAGEKVTATGLPKSVTSEEFWNWLTTADGLYDHDSSEWVETMHAGHPGWKVREYYERLHREMVEEQGLKHRAERNAKLRELGIDIGDD